VRKRNAQRRAGVAAVLAAAACAFVVARLGADISATPDWTIANGITRAEIRGDTVYVGGTFTQLFSPAITEDQFYDFVTGQVRADCARSTSAQRPLSGFLDNRGGLLVPVLPGDTFADVNGAFSLPEGTTLARIADTCLWDRQFAAPAIDPQVPADLSIGVPARAGNIVVTTNAVLGPDLITLRAQAAAFDATTGARLAYQFYQGRSEVGVLGATATRIIVRVRSSAFGAYTLGAIDPSTLVLTDGTVTLADETIGARSWVRGDVLYRLRPPPSNTLEAFDLTTLRPRAGWTAPVVPALTDLEVVGNRVFLAARVVGGVAVPPPAALNAATGALDAAWTPPALTRRVPDPGGVPYQPALTSLATDGQRLYFAGDFERVGGADRDGVAALSVASGALDAWDAAPFLVSPLEATTTALLATRPTGANRVTRRFLAAIDRATGVARAWNPNDPGRVLLHQPTPVAALTVDAAWVYFASATTGEVLRAAIATGDVDPAWRVVVTRADNSSGVVTSMVNTGGFVYLGGDFERVSGTAIPPTTRRAVAAVAVDGSLAPWAPQLEGLNGVTLRALLAQGPTIYIGGDFTSVNGQFRLGFAAVDAVSGVPSQPEMVVLGETSIYGLATDGARTFVSGASFGAPLVGSVNPADSVLTAFGPTINAVPTSAAFVAGRLYAGLEYDPDAGTATTRVTRWSRVTADDQGLVNISDDGTLEYYAAVPGNPPAAPTLVATANDNTVVASWTPSPTGAAATSYTLWAGSAPGLANLAAIPMQRATSFTATAPTGLYYLTVVARNGYGASPASNEVPVQLGCLAPPPAPGTLTFLTAGSTVALRWGSALSASSYTIEAGQAPGSANLGAIPVRNVTTFATPAPRGTYYVRVRAVNRCGLSGPSNEVAIVLDGTTTLPVTPTGFVGGVNGRTVTFQWTPATTGGLPARYQIEAGSTSGGVIAVLPTTSTQLVVPNAPSGTFYVRVRAVNAAGASEPTADIPITVP
jgi:hypothetical protein